MASFTLKNQYVIPLLSFLELQELSGKKSRMRTRFIKLITDRAKEIEEERLKICKQFAEKRKEEGSEEELVVGYDKENKETTEARSIKTYKIADMEGFEKAYGEILAEDLVLDVTDGNKDTFEWTKNIVLDSETKLIGRDAVAYEGFCEAFEAV
jgi:hypothetical protein